MEAPGTPRLQTESSARRPPSPPTPEVARRIEENRLKAKAIRAQHEADARAAGKSTLPPKTASGLVATDDIHIVGGDNGGGGRVTRSSGKRPHSETVEPSARASTSINRATVPASNRDARTTPTKPGEQAPLRPAPKFAKYVDYNFSTMTDTKGGFMTVDDDPHNYALNAGVGKGKDAAEQRPTGMTQEEWERKQLLKKLQRQKAGPFEPGMSSLVAETERKKCRECDSLEIDFVWEEVFNIRVCGMCKEKFPEKYSLLTKTECRQDYLLTEPELKDPELLPHLNKPNPHKSHWHDMMLFLRCQVEEYALGPDRWGSAEALDAEFERRESEKRRRKETKFKTKLAELKKRTQADAFRRHTKAGLAESGGTRAKNFGDRIGALGPHVHDWGRAVENEAGMSVKTCQSCGMEVEELEF